MGILNDLIVFKGVRRVNEFADPELLEVNEAARLENMVLDIEGGKAIKRGGFNIFNTNSTGGAVKSLHDVVDSSDNNLLFAVVTTTLKKSTDGTGAWSNLKTGLSNNLKTKLEPYDGTFFITNGTDTVFTTDGTSTWDLEVSAPSVTNITSAHASGGSLSASVQYKYIIVYVTDREEYSPPSQPITHYLSTSNNTSTDSTNKQLRFDSVPTSSDSRVVARLIFRTKANGDVYYLLKRIDNIDTYFEDDEADTILDTSQSVEYINVPTKAGYPAINKERLFLGKVTLTQKNFVAPTHSNVAVSPPSGWTNGVEFSGVGTTVS